MEENKPLAPFTTLGIGGPARWFVEAASEDDIVDATEWATQRGLALFVLGGGSNLLVADAGFDGLVVRVGLRGVAAEPAAKELGTEGGGGFNLRIAPSKSARFSAPAGRISPTPPAIPNSSAASESHGGAPAHRIYRAAAGEDWDRFVERTVEDNCAGVECLAGIPGTIGGTPVQNVGAYGQEVASAIEQARVFDLKERVFQELSAEECGFAYRHSRFNSTDRGRFIVTRVDYRLTIGGAPTLRYSDLQRALQESMNDGKLPSLVEVAAMVRQIRHAKGMLLVAGDPDCRSAGSFFKNPVVSEQLAGRIGAAIGKDPPRFPAQPGHVKLPAAWLIEQAGFAKGYAPGAAGISSRHTLALINRGGATAQELLSLAAEINAAVELQFGIRLEMEPVMAGF